MAIWLHFSFWWLSFDISALFRLSESGGRLLVTNGFHIGCAEFSIVIDRLAILVDGFAVDSGISLNCVPLTAAGILEDLIVTTRCGISGDIIELCAGTILVPDFKVAVLTVRAVNLRDRKIITGQSNMGITSSVSLDIPYASLSQSNCRPESRAAGRLQRSPESSG